MLARIMDNKCGSKLIYETSPGKEVVYVLPITSVLGRLPVVRAGDSGTIPFGYRNGCRNSAHRYNHYLASDDSSSGAGDSCPMYFVNSCQFPGRLAGPATVRPLKCNKV